MARIDIDRRTVGLIIVDHGSRRDESNDMLLEVVRKFTEQADWPVVEPAHMELAEPSIGTAFDRCVQRGARMICVHPYFLLPGRHWDQDIPRLVGEAATKHPDIPWLVTAPLGLHPMMFHVMQDRIAHCLRRAEGRAEECDVCAGTGKCILRQGATVGVAD